MTIVLEHHTVDYMPVTFLERRYTVKYEIQCPIRDFTKRGELDL